MVSETEGGFVEIEHERAGRETLFLMGAREAIDRWIVRLRSLAVSQTHAGVAQVMMEISDEMAKDRDGIAVALTKVAIKDGSGKLEKLRQQ